MKNLLLLSILLIGAFKSYSQTENNIINKPIATADRVVTPTGPNDISQDSLNVLYERIDELGISQLSKVQEMFRYKIYHEPTQQNKDLLLYIDKKLNELE